MIINWDQTAVKYVPVSDWTKEVRGAKRVHIKGKDDKRQLTATLTVTASGEMLPAQMIYGDKTPICLPSLAFLPGWHITFTLNHWANEDTLLAYIHNMLLPYITSTHQKLKCHSMPMLVLFDHFKAQLTDCVLDTLESHDITVIDMPAKCTDDLQPLGVSINKAIKHHMRESFQSWYANEILKREYKLINLKLSTLKPLVAQWFVCAFAHVSKNNQIIKNSFNEVAITSKLN